MFGKYSPRTDSIDLSGKRVLHKREDVWGTVFQDEYSSLMVIWDDDESKTPEFIWIDKVYIPELNKIQLT